MAIDTLAELRAAAQDEADKENDPSITTAQWNRRVNDGYRSLWNLIRSENETFFVTRTSATVATQANNFLNTTLVNQRMRALWFVTGSTPDDYERVRRWNLEERAYDRGYIIVGQQIFIYPSNLAVGSYTLWLESAFVELLADIDIIDARLIEWSEYIYLYAALGGRDKEESDVSILGQRLVRLEREIVSITRDLDAAEPARVVRAEPRGYYRPTRLPRP